MTTVATHPAPLILPPGLVPYRLSVDQYEAMVRADILTDDRLELIEGLLVKKMTKKPDHSASSEGTWRAIHAALPPAGTSGSRNPCESPHGIACPSPMCPWSAVAP